MFIRDKRVRDKESQLYFHADSKSVRCESVYQKCTTFYLPLGRFSRRQIDDILLFFFLLLFFSSFFFSSKIGFDIFCENKNISICSLLKEIPSMLCV